MNTHIGDTIFQNTSRRVAKFRENRLRDDERSVDGKKIKKTRIKHRVAIAIIQLKLWPIKSQNVVAMATSLTSLRPSISAMSSLYSLTPKNYH